MDYLTLISPVWAHGSTTAGDTPGGSYGPLILLVVAAVVVLVFVAEKQWKNRKNGHKTGRNNDGK